MIERKQEEAVKNAVLLQLLYYCTMCASKHYDVCASKGFDVVGLCLHLAQCSSGNPANIFSRVLASALLSERRQNRPVAGVKETQPKKGLGGFSGGFLRIKPLSRQNPAKFCPTPWCETYRARGGRGGRARTRAARRGAS